MRREVDLRALRAFQSIMRTGSVTAAAREMGLSQPAMSRVLAGLEAEVGFELFHRERGRLVPNPDALLMMEEVNLALSTVERVERLAEDIAQYRVGQLRLVAPPSLSEGVLPDLVEAFLAEHPRVNLTIDSRSVDTALAMIASRGVDGGFVKLPISRPDLVTETLLKSETACVLPADHPLTSHRSLSPAQLRDAPLILLGMGRSSRIQIETAFRAENVRPNARIDTHTIGSACALAARGLGIAIVNEALAQPYLGNRLVIRPFRPRMVQEYAFATAAGVPPTRLAGEFLRLAKLHFAKMKQGETTP
jgi:DNA-binding transcriptional LysR family regulator